ncbi:MAG: phosphopantothenoylcysteine decarboxylase [Opitutales bacterium]|nr:phosphopantothenoylcysteine decarboxylase [Opitutales bacterium]
MNLEGKKIALAVTGSIAAYKAADICSALTKSGAEVRVLMTPEAKAFIAPLTLQTLSRNPVAQDMWALPEKWQPEHIEIATWADLFLVAPATANIIACFAVGLAPDIVSATYLATRAPALIAPAMNCNMLEHPATQANLEILRSRGNKIVEPANGRLACGTEGKGCLASVETIVETVKNILV